MRRIAALAAMILMLSCPVWSLSFSGSAQLSFGISGSLTLKGTTEPPAPPSSGWLNATMTSNTAPSPNECYDDYANTDVWVCFDHKVDVARSVVAPESYMVFDFGSGNTKVCNHVYLTGMGLSTGIKDWIFYGSNNGASWTSLGSGTAADNALRQSLSITNSTAYRYYKLYWSSVYDEMAMGTYIYEVELWNE